MEEGLLRALTEAATSDDASDHLPMTCTMKHQGTTCGERCADRAESYLHTHRTAHARFQQVRAEAATSDDASDHVPMTCTTCGERCANRAESYLHTHRTGHVRFRAIRADSKHCQHCAGRRGLCACSEGCPRKSGSECLAVDSVRAGSNHCEHCRGLEGGLCACSEGCPRKSQSQCMAQDDEEDLQLRDLLSRVTEPRRQARQQRNRGGRGHAFDGNECGVCRQCGRCTYRITGHTSCINDRGRRRDDRPRICGCGGGRPVCSRCGVGPCCQESPCTAGVQANRQTRENEDPVSNVRRESPGTSDELAKLKGELRCDFSFPSGTRYADDELFDIRDDVLERITGWKPGTVLTLGARRDRLTLIGLRPDPISGDPRVWWHFQNEDETHHGAGMLPKWEAMRALMQDTGERVDLVAFRDFLKRLPGADARYRQAQENKVPRSAPIPASVLAEDGEELKMALALSLSEAQAHQGSLPPSPPVPSAPTPAAPPAPPAPKAAAKATAKAAAIAAATPAAPEGYSPPQNGPGQIRENWRLCLASACGSALLLLAVLPFHLRKVPATQEVYLDSIGIGAAIWGAFFSWMSLVYLCISEPQVDWTHGEVDVNEAHVQAVFGTYDRAWSLKGRLMSFILLLMRLALNATAIAVSFWSLPTRDPLEPGNTGKHCAAWFEFPTIVFGLVRLASYFIMAACESVAPGQSVFACVSLAAELPWFSTFSVLATLTKANTIKAIEAIARVKIAKGASLAMLKTFECCILCALALMAIYVKLVQLDFAVSSTVWDWSPSQVLIFAAFINNVAGLEGSLEGDTSSSEKFAIFQARRARDPDAFMAEYNKKLAETLRTSYGSVLALVIFATISSEDLSNLLERSLTLGSLSGGPEVTASRLAPPPAPKAMAMAAATAAAPAAADPRFSDYAYIASCTNNFSPDRSLGTGAYGTVYHGVDPDNFVEFAAKRLECQDAQQREYLERMTAAEVRVLTAFLHPNILPLLGHCTHADGAILVYEFQPNGSLDQHLIHDDKARQLTWGRRSSIVSGLLEAVSYLHHHNPQGPCYHGDIKPGNIMLTASFSPKLGDCGLSHFLPQDRPGQKRNRLQLSHSVPVGTPGFMCKRYVVSGNFNDKSEVYSIGVTILQMITAKMDFDDDFSDLIEEADEEQIVKNHDQRVPANGPDLETLKKLSAMAAASVQRLSKRIQVLPLLRQAREAAATESTSEIPALKSEVEQTAAELRQLRRE